MTIKQTCACGKCKLNTLEEIEKMIDEELDWRNCPCDNKGGEILYEQKYKTLIKFKQQLKELGEKKK